MGTVLSFDEIFGPPRIQQEELRALQEASRTHGFKWRFITYLNHPKTLFGRAAVQVTAIPATCGADSRPINDRAIEKGREANGGERSENSYSHHMFTPGAYGTHGVFGTASISSHIHQNGHLPKIENKHISFLELGGIICEIVGESSCSIPTNMSQYSEYAACLAMLIASVDEECNRVDDDRAYELRCRARAYLWSTQHHMVELLYN